MTDVAKSLNASITTVGEVVRRAQMPAPLLTQAFLLPHPVANKPQFAVVDMQDGSYMLLAVDKVQDGDLSKVLPEQRTALRQQMAQAYGYEATRELINQLKAKTEIKINKTLM
jgi:peptidyl-prolyl cis-trans isomerase D